MKSVDVLNASILVVDDREANVELIMKLLTQVGYTNIVSTTDPKLVFDLHQKSDFDLILLDLELPGMDGFQVMHQLKSSKTDPYLSVIVLTAHPEHKLRALQDGAKDFISKPFNILEVQTRIHNVLEVRLLHKQLEKYVAQLEQRVLERTAELQESEARFKSFTELASDWYWEQNAAGECTRISGSVPPVLGIQMNAEGTPIQAQQLIGWNVEKQSELQAMIAARASFIDFEFSCRKPDGIEQKFRVSGQPMFDSSCTFLGYRGIGAEISHKQEEALR